MKKNLAHGRSDAFFIVLTAAIVLIMNCLPSAAIFASGQDVTSADLMAQVTDPAQTLPAGTETTTQPAAATDSGFDAEALEQLVAPIALYPDALLMQILMASTYPLEIVEAARWIGKNPELEGDALNEALKEEDWDPSVKSLTTLPSVLKQMSENLDWTQDLGDAFLAQKNDLMDTVQRMRGLAYAEGNLETTEQQTVTQQPDQIIIIESASPEVIYVPTYSPTVVYGVGWGYPYWRYPGWYYPPMPGYGLVAFGVGVAVGGAIWGGARWGWGNNDVNININRQNEFNRNTNIGGGNQINAQGRGGSGTAAWQHDASHRKGVNYGSSDVAQKYGGGPGSNRVTQDQARGRSTASTSNRGSGAGQGSNRNTASTRDTASNRSAASNRNTASNRSGSGNYSSLSGSRSPSTDRASSYRGASSRGTSSFGGSRGGASRGGGRRR